MADPCKNQQKAYDDAMKAIEPFLNDLVDLEQQQDELFDQLDDINEAIDAIDDDLSKPGAFDRWNALQKQKEQLKRKLRDRLAREQKILDSRRYKDALKKAKDAFGKLCDCRRKHPDTDPP
jgi:ABC-type transporter Mla subunit MlaD